MSLESESIRLPFRCPQHQRKLLETTRCTMLSLCRFSPGLESSHGKKKKKDRYQNLRFPESRRLILKSTRENLGCKSLSNTVMGWIRETHRERNTHSGVGVGTYRPLTSQNMTLIWRGGFETGDDIKRGPLGWVLIQHVQQCYRKGTFGHGESTHTERVPCGKIPGECDHLWTKGRLWALFLTVLRRSQLCRCLHVRFPPNREAISVCCSGQPLCGTFVRLLCYLDVDVCVRQWESNSEIGRKCRSFEAHDPKGVL